jgi:hypothetical protein
LIASIGIFIVYVNPTYTKQVIPLQAQIKQLNSTIAAAEEFNKKEAQIATERNALPADSIARLQSYLPDSVDNVQLVLDLNTLAARSGLTLSDLDIAAGTGTEQVAPAAGADASGALPLQSVSSKISDSLQISFKAKGPYAGFRTFLMTLEESLRPMDLTHIEIKTDPLLPDTFSLTFTIYWLH